MRPLFAAWYIAAACVIAGFAGVPGTAHAQQWNDARTMALVDLAIARRAAQLADTGLADYRANAHGYLTFLAQVGEGFPDPPKVVRTDELALEVYWRAPNQSKQRIVGRRDTLLLPTDIAYHRDHLAILPNNFPSIIRLGEGDEVRDVPHPLSAAGRGAYDFAIADSQTIRTANRAFAVIEVTVRPKMDRLPRAVGAVYLDRANGTVVRMALAFTRAALIDPQLEDVSIILENGLVDGRFWLPYRQEVEIRRVGSWMAFPARGIIRGRWEVCCIEVNRGLPASLFDGPEIVAAPADQLRAHVFTGTILRTLPAESRMGETDEVRRVQDEARALVREQALGHDDRTTLSAGAISDLVRMNRVEGIAVGAGITRTLGAGISGTGRARFGTADHAFKGFASVAWDHPGLVRIALSARDDFREAGDEPEVSGLRNTFASQAFGSDFSDAYRVQGVTLALHGGPRSDAAWRVSLDRERQDALAVHARPALGAFTPAFAAQPVTAWRASIGGLRGGAQWPLGSTWRVEGSASVAHLRFEQAADSGGEGWVGRAAVVANAERPFGEDRLVGHTTAAIAIGPRVPRQDLVYFGGPVTGPGFDYHALSGSVGVSQRLEWRHPVASMPVELGRFGRLSMAVTIAPFAQMIWLDGRGAHPAAPRGLYPAAGVGVVTLFDLLRFDVARGLRDGRWTFSVDFTRDFWRIL